MEKTVADLMQELKEEVERNNGEDLSSFTTEGLARRFADLKAKKYDLQEQMKEIDQSISAIEESLLERMITASVSNMKVDGAMVHIREEIWPALVVPDGMEESDARFKAVQTLIELGHTRQVNFNTQSMRALVREMMDDSGALPSPLGDFVKAEIRHRLGVRGARGRLVD